jgi:MoaA/NifB/PqqE/SkfB family radical SAM enzyme
LGIRVGVENFHGAPYQQRVLELQQGPYLDFPAVLGIETLALCNAACDFCPYPGMERKGEAMPDRLIAEIPDDIEDISQRPPITSNPLESS